MSASTLTGYGPSHAHRLYFDGNEEKYELWEVKFKAYLCTRKLLSVVTGQREETANFRKRNQKVYAELVQVLDDKSLSLIIRDAADDGKRAMEIPQR